MYFLKTAGAQAGRCLLASSLVSQLASTGAYLVAQTVKRLPTMREARVRSLGQEDSLEKETASHSSTLAQNSMDGGAWWATVHGVAKNRTRLIDFTFCPQGPRGTGERSLKAAPGDPTLLRRIPAAGALRVELHIFSAGPPARSNHGHARPGMRFECAA